MTKKPGWKELLEGDLIGAGTSKKFTTADWRSERPIFNKDICIDCKFCWIYCPDSSILLDENNKVSGIDYDHCKGCGICSFECPTKPVKAMTMENEHK